MKKRVFIIEDHAVMRQTYKVLFGQLQEIEVCGTAATAEEALDAVSEMNPDLVMVDISLPGMNGLRCTEVLRGRYPDLRILVTSGHDSEQYAREAERSGADGFVTKGDFQMLLAEVNRLLLE